MKRLELLIQETHDAVLRIDTFLFGPEGGNGMSSDFKEVSRDHYRLKRCFYCLLALLLGLGILQGISVFGG
ncbi:MAG: hypothetical protein PHQ43_08855 [Dehalococcoidales bacterium]|nr:hypothetical protein [Dehalococcoidales bacterium]